MSKRQTQRRLMRRRLHQRTAQERAGMLMGELDALAREIAAMPWYKRVWHRLAA